MCEVSLLNHCQAKIKSHLYICVVSMLTDIDFSIGERKELHYRACREYRAQFGWRHLLTVTIPTSVQFVLHCIYSLFKYKTIYLTNYIGNPTDWRVCFISVVSFVL